MRWLNVFFVLPVLFSISCKINPSASANYSDSQAFNLIIDPASGTKYHYTIINSTELEINYNGTEVHNENVATVGLIYKVTTDSARNLQIKIKYDQIQLSSKTGDHETNLDADNAAFSSNPTERMLAVLKGAELTLSRDEKGNFKLTQGYEDISKKLLAFLDTTDIAARSIAKDHIDRTIRDGIIQNNLDQLFKIFPDSAVRRGDKWKIINKQSAEFPLNATTYYTLQSINESIALINAESRIVADSKPVTAMGQTVIPNLSGEQHTRYEIESKTGIISKSESKGELKGSLNMMGVDLPIKIRIRSTIKGEKAD